jgi:hypothetical protein
VEDSKVVPKVFRITLTEEQWDELHHGFRGPKTKPPTRERLERVRLSDAGMTISKIAPILRQSESRVRHWIQRLLKERFFDALNNAPHPGMPSALTSDRLAINNRPMSHYYTLKYNPVVWPPPDASIPAGVEASREELAEDATICCGEAVLQKTSTQPHEERWVYQTEYRLACPRHGPAQIVRLSRLDWISPNEYFRVTRRENE